MNSVEIEEAISELAGKQFGPPSFPFAFLEAFGKKKATTKGLRSGSTNMFELGGVLQCLNIHINRTKLENLIHRVFESSRPDIKIQDRFGSPVTPREWFLVPLFVIDDAIEKVKDGTISNHIYDPQGACPKHARQK